MSSVEGIADFNKALLELKQDLRKRVVRSALRAAAKPIIAAAKAAAPVRTGLVRSRVVVTASRLATRRGEIGVYIKPRSAKGVRKGSKLDPFYFQFSITGFHATGGRKIYGGKLLRARNLAGQVKAGRARFIPGRDWLGASFNAQSGAALRIFQEKLKQRIDAANKRK